MRNTKSKLFIIALIAIVTAILMMITSCGSQSSAYDRHLKAQQELIEKAPYEKVVILDSEEHNSTDDTYLTRYKIKRLSKGVTCFINTERGYEANDTILWRFTN